MVAQLLFDLELETNSKLAAVKYIKAKWRSDELTQKMEKEIREMKCSIQEGLHYKTSRNVYKEKVEEATLQIKKRYSGYRRWPRIEAISVELQRELRKPEVIKAAQEKLFENLVTAIEDHYRTWNIRQLPGLPSGVLLSSKTRLQKNGSRRLSYSQDIKKIKENQCLICQQV